MSIDFAIRPNRIPWPPLIYAGAIGLALALGAFWPLAVGAMRAHAEGLRVVGICVMVAGAVCDVSAMRTMSRHRVNILPHRAATALLTTGPFAWSRNPIYLGNGLMLAGAAPAFGNLWFLALVPVSVALVTVLAIRREERHLAAVFGPEWRAYAAATPRWLLRL